MSYFEDNYAALTYPLASDGRAGLRNSQLGAAHAIASHFTLHDTPAIIVLPTGAGKTAVLFMSAFILRAYRVLIVTPSRLVRSQIADDANSLETLKKLNILGPSLTTPNVLELEECIESTKGWEELRAHDVVVATPKTVSPGFEKIPAPPDDLFDLVLVDEAHHSPARTWSALFDSFHTARRVLFTATPFRRDRKEIVGRLVYSYSVKQAFADDIFGTIHYEPVDVEPGSDVDTAIAKAAEKTLREDQKTGLEHLLMVRTDSKKRAKELKKIYADETGLNLRSIHSDLSGKYVKRVIEDLRTQKLDGIICVDMLGEGFDLPSLKVAAIHAPHKSLEVTLQFIGRFARTSGGECLGKATFLARPSEIKIEAQRLYEEGAAWQKIVQNLSDTRVQKELELREAIQSFREPVRSTEETENLSLYSLRPYSHVKIFHTSTEVDLEGDVAFPSPHEIVHRQYSDELNAMLIVTKQIQKQRWSDSDVLASSEYDLFVVHHHRESGLLFINASQRTIALYETIAASVCEGHYNILSLNRINRVLSGFEKANFFNIGMKNRALGNNTESYRIITGSSAQGAISETDGRLYHRGHVFGTAYNKEGHSVTLGYSSASKVWSHQNRQVPELVKWCQNLATRISGPPPKVKIAGLEHLGVGEEIDKVPNDVLSVEWDVAAFKRARCAKFQVDDGGTKRPSKTPILNLEFVVDRERSTGSEVVFVVRGPGLECAVKYVLDANGYSFSFADEQREILIEEKKEWVGLLQYLNSNPPDMYLADFSRVRGNEIFVAPEDPVAFSNDRVVAIDWAASAVDIQKEFGTPDSIHSHIEAMIADEEHGAVIYDHRVGEIADFICVTERGQETVIELLHCKAAGGPKPGNRVDDVYEVAGQVIKSLVWLKKLDALRARLLERLDSGSRFVVGDTSTLRRLLSRAERRAVRYQIVLVQPGISRANIQERLSVVLAAADDYLRSAKAERLLVWGSP